MATSVRTMDATPKLVAALVEIQAEADRALRMLAVPNRPPEISGQSALMRIRNKARDRLEPAEGFPSSGKASGRV